MRLLIAVSSEGIHPFGSSVRLSLNRTAKDNLVWASVQGGEDLWLSSGLLSLLRQWAGDGTHDSVEGFGQGPLSPSLVRSWGSTRTMCTCLRDISFWC